MMIFKRVISILLALSMVSMTFANSFVCSKDPAYIDYKAGNSLNLNGAIKYAGQTICENNCRSYSTCVAETSNPGSFYCPSRRYENIGGDLESGTNFSNKSSCNTNCFAQNSCAELVPNPCKPVNIEYVNPVTDYTGKTVYTERKITYECNSTQTKTIGCDKWEIKLNSGSFDYNTSGVGTIFKSRTETDKAQNIMAMLEQQLHIFSGWEGQCESGTMFDNPFSDPMAILGYAMMVYSAAGEISKDATGVSKEVKDIHDGIQKGFDTASKTVEKINPFANGGTTNVAANELNAANAAGKSVLGSIPPPVDSFSDTLSKLNDTSISIYGDVHLLYTDIAKLAMAALAPSDEELQQADYFNKAWLGSSDADEASLAYANCMASIGLSFPNMVSFSADDMNNTSPELQNTLSNPIRLTTDQVAMLMDATSVKYVEAAYLPLDYDEATGIITYVALNRVAFEQAGQVICAGKLATAINIDNQVAGENSSSGGGSGSAIGIAVAKMAIQKIAMIMGGPIAGIIASVIIDLVTSLKSGDACHDKDIASQWGLIQLKTNTFLNFDQCHATKTECAAKWFWGSCMRTRHKYCCYDQISTRIFAEGLKQEMYPPIDPKTNLPNKHIWDSCNDITINDLKDISFRKCNTDEEPYADHCFPSDKYKEFSDAIKKSGVVGFDFKGAADQAINSLAIPNKLCNTPQ
jgi:hypothetical protein